MCGLQLSALLFFINIELEGENVLMKSYFNSKNSDPSTISLPVHIKFSFHVISVI